MMMLADRVELLEAQDRFDPRCRIEANEVFLLVVRTADGGLVLR